MRDRNLMAIGVHRHLFPADTLTRLAAPVPGTGLAFTAHEKTFQVTAAGSSFFMHSRYDPLKEARELVKDIPGDRETDIVVVLGVGAGHVVRELTAACPDIAVIAVEPSYETFDFVLSHFDMTDIIGNEHVTWFIGDDQLKDIEQYLSLISTKKIRIITMRGYHRLFPAYLGGLAHGILDFVDKKSINLNTIMRFDRLWAYNSIANTSVLPFASGVNRLYDAFKDIPAVIVSAGPSLEKNIRMLASMKKKAVIIAVDTALKPLSLHGIIPHFTAAVDPQGKNAKYFRGIKTDDTILVAEPSIHNEIFRSYKGPVYLMDSVFPLAQRLMSHRGAHGEITMGGSVSTTAFDLAYRMGANPIIMLGLDLSYPKLATHVKGSFHEDDFLTQIGKLDTYDGRVYKLLLAGRLSPALDIHGETVFVDARFIMYRDWFERHIAAHPGVTVYNATEGGIPVKGMVNRPLAQIAAELPDRDIIVAPFFTDSLDNDAMKDICDRIRDDFHAIAEDLARIRKLVDNGLMLTRNLERELHHKRDVSAIITALDKNDEAIIDCGNAKDFIGITMQRTIHMLKEGYQLDDNAPDGKKNGMNAVTNSRTFYREMLRSIDFNEQLIAMGLERIDEKERRLHA